MTAGNVISKASSYIKQPGAGHTTTATSPQPAPPQHVSPTWPGPQLQPISRDNANLQTQCLLFHLPIELRIMIYDRLLIMPNATAQISQDSSQRTLALLQTCRLIYAEAVTIFYRSNTLTFPCIKNMAMDRSSVILFIRSVCSERLAAIRRVTLCKIPENGFPSAIAAMQKTVPALQVLWIERKYPAGFIGLENWQDIAPGLREQLAEFPRLRELRFLEPEVSGPKRQPWEEEWQAVKRKRALQIDDMLMQLVESRTSENKQE